MDQLAQALINEGQTAIPNVLLLHYREIGMTNDELMVYLQFKRLLDQGSQFPDANLVAQSLGEDTNTVFQRLHEMLAKKLLTIESVTAADQKIHDRYNFTGIYDKLAVALAKPAPATANTTGTGNARQQVFRNIEQEFGRGLSSFEMEFISKWFDEDHYPAEIIDLALRESVLSQVYNLKYMDRILLNWHKRNLTTAAQIEADRQSGLEKRLNQAPKTRQTGDNAGPKIPLFKLGEDQQ
ncbi:DNA replication protein DnaD [Lactobacillus plantarum JDM1] [Lactiplantibacillus mudanjiangensis]|uniref:DnaD domain-containing protein n=1 Tax=Lactiplantibacillus mudanjiangensis TaxID=1296538 RepID=UPI00101588DA|nr:DnaD domain protein [Lactiplantibacillus mudanjiangensis]VDG31171.1 DNA replication protein DnaD [Lactobacillus plantarum JDM1] [Lactiplantibacillus mudanjiangensis]